MDRAPIIVWFRNDLRTIDHPALTAAASADAPIVAVYVLDDESAGRWARGGASRWWLHGSLAALAGELERLGGRLVLRRGRCADVICEIADNVGAQAVYCSRSYEPWSAGIEADLKDRLGQSGIEFRRFAGVLLVDPDRVSTQSGSPFKVYTPFWRAISAGTVRRSLPAPKSISGFDGSVAGDQLQDWALRPSRPDWAGGLRQSWEPGQAIAAKKLKSFFRRAGADYHNDRDRPDLAGTSRLSPHLHFGEISPAMCWHAALAEAGRNASSERGLEVFRKELVWREFSYHLLYHWPQLPETPFRDQFAVFPWQEESKERQHAVDAWQRGCTGYPIVDAGMRELWATGWMHNRVRMVTASFLTKHLLVPWQVGEAWFWDCLVDADLASNAASWQWVAGSGADAAPYFRIFNPIKQGEKFDPQGTYVRRWVPEIAALDDKYLFAPWTAPDGELQRAGIQLGETYPRPIVEHDVARKRALAAYDMLKAREAAAR